MLAACLPAFINLMYPITYPLGADGQTSQGYLGEWRSPRVLELVHNVDMFFRQSLMTVIPHEMLLKSETSELFAPLRNTFHFQI